MPKTLLVVDDSNTMQKVFEIIFAHEDVRIVPARNADEAMAAVRQVAPDAALVDAVLPGTSGYDVTAHLRSMPHLAQMPVLMLACGFEAFDENRARASGASAWIQKPVDSTGVLEKVMGAMGVQAVSIVSTAARPAGSIAARPAAPPPAAPPPPAPPPAPPAPPPAAFAPPHTPAPPPAAPRPAVPPAAAAPAFGAPRTGAPLAPPAAAPAFGAPRTGAPAAPPPAAGWPAPPAAAPSMAGWPAPPAAHAAPHAPVHVAPPPPPPPPVVVAPPPPPPPPVVAAPPPPPPPPAVAAPPPPPAPPPVVAAPPAVMAAPPAAAVHVPAMADALSAAMASKVPAGIDAATRDIIERVVWEVVPELAETIIREEIRRLLKARGGI